MNDDELQGNTGAYASFRNLAAIEARVANLVHSGGGEGVTVFTATFDGMPPVLIDEGTAAELLPDQEQADAIRVHVFDTEQERHDFLHTVGIGRPGCPTCLSTDAVIPIVYGEPGPELEERRRRGELILAGCIITGEGRSWHCKRCKKDFGPLMLG